jgi:hypothetical protein
MAVLESQSQNVPKMPCFMTVLYLIEFSRLTPFHLLACDAFLSSASIRERGLCLNDLLKTRRIKDRGLQCLDGTVSMEFHAAMGVECAYTSNHFSPDGLPVSRKMLGSNAALSLSS